MTHKETPEPEKDIDRKEASGEAPKKKVSRLRRALKLGLFLLYMLIIAEIASRAYWSIKNQDRAMPLFASWDDWIDLFYAEVRDSGVAETNPRQDDESFDILLLGGSALDRVYTSLADTKLETPALQEKLSARLGKPVRVFNLAAPAKTTRDSLIKYRILSEKGYRFDLIMVYHGINDTRMNNIASEKFRDDYTHSGYYAQFKRLQAHRPILPYFTLPYTLEYTIIHALSSKKIGVYLPKHRPSPSQLAHSADIKTAGAFGKNIQAILDLADSQSEPVLLMTFAWYIPSDYTREKCKAKKLDYADCPRPSRVEMWGSLEGVPKGLQAHNQAIRQSAKGQADVLLVDAELLIPKKGENFNDVCHLSEAGKQRLMDAFLPAIIDRFAPSPAPEPPATEAP